MTESELRAAVAADLVSGVLPGASPIVQRLLTTVGHEWTRNRSTAMAAAVATSGLSREDLAQRIEEQPQLVPLVTRLLHQAAMTGQAPTLEAMGAVFGAAAREPSQVDDFDLLLAELTFLSGDNVLVLRAMRDRPVFRNEDEARADEPKPEERDWTESRELADAMGIGQDHLLFSLVRLSNHGFARTVPALGGTHYVLTEMGLLLYDALERLADVRRSQGVSP